MKWNWQQQYWTHFCWDTLCLWQAEWQFILGAKALITAMANLLGRESDQIVADLMTNEALATSEIEGDLLNRSAIESSISRRLGPDADDRHVGLPEQKIAELLVAAHRNFPPIFDDLIQSVRLYGSVNNEK